MRSKNKQPNIFIISGPSGAGEDAVINGLKKTIAFNRIVTTVTRKKRPGERQGHPYYFVTTARFKKMIAEKKLVEWAIVYGDYRGCSKQEVSRLLRAGKPIIWKVDWQGVKTIKKILPEAIAVFIAPPSYQVLEQRLIARGTDSLQTIKQRKRFTQEWLKHQGVYDYTVINRQGKLPQTIRRVAAIIKRHSA